MFCKTCGNQLNSNDTFCNFCGSPIENPQYNGNNPYNYPPQYYQPIQNSQNQKPFSGCSITSLILGILSILLFCLPIISILLGVLAIIFGIVGAASKKLGKGMGISGIITGIVGLVIGGIIVYAVYLNMNETASGREFFDSYTQAIKLFKHS